MDHYDIYKLSAFDEWVNGAYDEDGNSVICDLCGEEMKWNPVIQNWYCTACGQTMDRATYFNHICKKYCKHYVIDPFDPILD